MKPPVFMVICALAGCAFAGFLVIRQAYHPNTTNGGLLNSGWFSPRVEKSLTTDLLTPTATTRRGILATAGQYSPPYVITGTFTLSNSREHFEVVLRTNLSSPGASSTYEKREGVVVEFDKDRQVFSISNHTPAPTGGQLAKAPFSFITGQPYSFTITDTGTSVTVLIDGANSLSASTTFETGGYTGFYDGELPATADQLNSIAISTSP